MPDMLLQGEEFALLGFNLAFLQSFLAILFVLFG
jgi:hypothetical protein